MIIYIIPIKYCCQCHRNKRRQNAELESQNVACAMCRMCAVPCGERCALTRRFFRFPQSFCILVSRDLYWRSVSDTYGTPKTKFTCLRALPISHLEWNLQYHKSLGVPYCCSMMIYVYDQLQWY